MGEASDNNLEETANNSQSAPPTLYGMEQFDLIRSYLELLLYRTEIRIRNKTATTA